MCVLALRRIALSLVALFTLLGFPLATLSAASDGFASTSTPNDEGPFVGGVFSRPVGSPLKLPPKPEEFESPPLFDKAGNSNRVFVMLDFNDTIFDTLLPGKAVVGKPIEAEEAVLEAINTRSAMTEAFFAKPDKARYLIRPGDRLDAEARALRGENDSRVRLDRYIILSYPTVGAALAAAKQLNQLKGVLLAGVDQRLYYSWAPNDPYFQINTLGAGRYQWGMHAMNFPLAWDRSTGHGYVGAIDTWFPNTDASPGDLAANYRPQFSSFLGDQYFPKLEYHGIHVMGIIGATANNGAGVAGGCPTCSVGVARVYDLSDGNVATSITSLVDRGFQVVNMSFGRSSPPVDCAWSEAGVPPYCAAIDYADRRDVLLVAAAGNFNDDTPDFPARHPSVLSVGGVQNTNASSPGSWARWFYNVGNGSSHAGLSGVVAPAKSIVSTAPTGVGYNHLPHANCADTFRVENLNGNLITYLDESGIESDGYGSCTGTSMAAPHVSALAGILRSVNPRLFRDSIKNLIRSSGSHYAAQTAQLGSGLPNARLAVDLAVAQTPNRLTPLFSMYSAERRDYFYTTVPQMGAAASRGELRPVLDNTSNSNHRYTPVAGVWINGYFRFPDGYPFDRPVAEVWLFTTPENPKSASTPLVPLYRLSWKCGDTLPSPPICASAPQHTDTTYTADPNGVAAYQSWGYKLDGIEGYIYPKTQPQPAGTVRLMRKYNPVRDDHAIFPETALNAMTSQGYTENSGSDWLGYVYPNLTGAVPTIQ